MALLRIDPVFVFETSQEDDEDVKFTGTLFLRDKPEGQFIEWQLNETSVIKTAPKSELKNYKHVLNFNIADLKSIHETRSELPGCMQMTFILKCGSTLLPLHLPTSEAATLLNLLLEYIPLFKSAQDKHLYIVKTKKTFDDLNLFEPGVEDVRMFFTGQFTKVTKYLHGLGKELNRSRESLTSSTTPLYTLLNPPTPHQAASNPTTPHHAAPHPTTSNPPAPHPTTPHPTTPHHGDTSNTNDYKNTETIPLDCENGSEFEFMLGTSGGYLPPRPHVTRGSPITARDWSAQMDAEGRLTNPSAVRQLIFRRGVDGAIRQEVWKFLLGFYAWDSSAAERLQQRKSRIEDYFRMKLQWSSMDEGQVGRFTAFRDSKSLIEKDVWRTDRNHTFFMGCNNPNMHKLNDILLTHCMYNSDLGYVQGMSDLLSPILLIMEHEVDAFWCFAGFVRLVSHNFERDQQAMKNQLSQLQFLVTYLDPDFANYLKRNNSLNMLFAFRWLLILFKREFSFPDAMRLWEVLWTGLPCRNFHLLVCLSILDSIKSTLVENDFGFSEILKFVNDLAGRIDVEEVLKVAEGMFLQLTACPGGHCDLILCLKQADADSLVSPFQPFNPFDLKFSEKGKASNSSSKRQSPMHSPGDALQTDDTATTSSHSNNTPSTSNNNLSPHTTSPSQPAHPSSSVTTSVTTSDSSSIEVLEPFMGLFDPY